MLFKATHLADQLGHLPAQEGQPTPLQAHRGLPTLHRRVDPHTHPRVGGRWGRATLPPPHTRTRTIDAASTRLPLKPCARRRTPNQQVLLLTRAQTPRPSRTQCNTAKTPPTARTGSTRTTLRTPRIRLRASRTPRTDLLVRNILVPDRLPTGTPQLSGEALNSMIHRILREVGGPQLVTCNNKNNSTWYHSKNHNSTWHHNIT